MLDFLEFKNVPATDPDGNPIICNNENTCFFDAAQFCIAQDMMDNRAKARVLALVSEFLAPLDTSKIHCPPWVRVKPMLYALEAKPKIAQKLKQIAPTPSAEMEFEMLTDKLKPGDEITVFAIEDLYMKHSCYKNERKIVMGRLNDRTECYYMDKKLRKIMEDSIVIVKNGSEYPKILKLRYTVTGDYEFVDLPSFFPSI
jgi:hypothetical protein